VLLLLPSYNKLLEASLLLSTRAASCSPQQLLQQQVSSSLAVAI
jgi:hypothetical protein